MSLQIADWRDILSVLHETVDIWSAGLSGSDYHYFLSCQLKDPWFRRHCSIFVLKDGEKVQASCKLYILEFASRGRVFRLAGLGAVYTLKAFRGRGLATDLVNDIIDLCDDAQLDGVILHSEIDPQFYEEFGFEELGNAEVSIESAHIAGSASLHAALKKIESSFVQCLPLTFDVIPEISRHYSRWLREQPYGVIRSQSYWRYKVFNEQFLSRRAGALKPGLSVQLVENGYAITERFGENLRLLEIVGSDSARKIIWANLLMQILKGDVSRLRGWEAVIRDLGPTYKLPDLRIYFSDRDWGRGMILSLNPVLNDWLYVNPSPLLEFDHL